MNKNIIQTYTCTTFSLSFSCIFNVYFTVFGNSVLSPFFRFSWLLFDFGFLPLPFFGFVCSLGLISWLLPWLQCNVGVQILVNIPKLFLLMVQMSLLEIHIHIHPWAGYQTPLEQEWLLYFEINLTIWINIGLCGCDRPKINSIAWVYSNGLTCHPGQC